MNSSDTSAKILLVDDNLDVLDVIGIGLELLQYQVATCTNGSDALAMLSNFRPNVMIVDQGLQDICGIELGIRSRAILGSGDPLLLALFTGTASQSIRDQADEAGFDGFFAKPVRINAISDWIASHLAT